mmetsp:Transcript_5111/g.7795  ORF Transcript_5111/g.7795 Transcript_5111/m.7795 type:complete len:98 (+) Transcript_5111:246-539(+)
MSSSTLSSAGRAIFYLFVICQYARAVLRVEHDRLYRAWRVFNTFVSSTKLLNQSVDMKGDRLNLFDTRIIGGKEATEDAAIPTLSHSKIAFISVVAL